MNCKEFSVILIHKCGLDPKIPVLAGISGGPDSICLLDLLAGSGFKTIAAHLDHSLRSTSGEEADHVAKACEGYGIEFVQKKVNAAAWSQKHQLSVEEGSRILRYEFLFHEAKKAGAQAVLVAHHADDQTETVLMHLMRGSGLSGLAGMRMILVPNPWSQEIPLVRPLLNTWRKEIEDYCQQKSLEFVQDESNIDTRYFRNRIRRELIPVLKTYNPLIKNRLQKMSEVISQEDQFMALAVEKAWDETLIQQDDKFIRMDRNLVQSQHIAIIRRIVRKAILCLNHNLRDIEFDCVERGVEFIQRSNRVNQEVLCSGLSIFRYLRNEVVFAFENDPLNELWPQILLGEVISLSGKTEIWINKKWSLRVQQTMKRNPVNNIYSCQLDAEQLHGDLVLSTFKPGDLFMPFGMAGKTKKLGDFWTNEGLPSRARKRWPLMRSSDQIVWVPGFRIADSVKVTEETQNIIQLDLIKK